MKQYVLSIRALRKTDIFKWIGTTYMVTKILKAEKKENIEEGARILKNGGLVAFPTETVYGLGANGLCGEAVNNIFKAKGRPNDNPLILHVSSIEQAEMLYSDVPELFYKLSSVFWPAPLTLICKKSKLVPQEVSAGLDTVAVRMPANEYALKLIECVGGPIAAPSANLSGRPSPTEAEHVIHDMGGRIDAILDGGRCRYGVESTVVSLVDEVPLVLRPGAVTPKMLSAVTGCEIKVAKSVCSPLLEDENVLSPGMKYKHYAPDAQVIAFAGTQERMVRKIIEMYDDKTESRCIIFSSEETDASYGDRETVVIGKRSAPESLCSNLFSALRQYDDYDFILCEAVDAKEEGLAYMNRLLRACGFRIF